MEKKILFSILLLSITNLTGYAQGLEKDTIKMQALNIFSNGKIEGINWVKISLDEAAQKAELQQKKILIYFTAKWCGPCRKMEQEVFSDYKVIRIVNDNYIALKIDVDAWGGKKWVKDFAVKGMPDFYILDAKKQRLRHNLGATPLNQFIVFLNLKEIQANLAMLDTTHAIVRAEKWKGKIGLGLGSGISNLSNSSSSIIFAYEVRLGYSLERRRLSFSPAVSFTSIGSSALRLNYVKIPAQVSLNFYMGSVLGLPGGYRVLAAPYYGRLLTNSMLAPSRNDIGVDYGLGVYMGDSANSSLEFSIRGSKGFTDVLPATGKQTNQFFRAAFTLSMRKR